MRDALSRKTSGFALVACAVACLVVWALGAPAQAFADDDSKYTVPTVVKQVAEVDADGASTWQQVADAQMGEWIAFRLTGTLPSNIEDFDSYFYQFNDQVNASSTTSALTVLTTGDGALEPDVDSVAVAVVDAETEAQTDVTAQASIAYDEDAGLLTVTFADLQALGIELAADDTVVVTYNARLVAGVAQAGVDDGAYGYATIVYTESTDSDELGTSAQSATTVYTWALQLTKVDAQTSAVLPGAVFTVQAADGSYVAADGTLSDEEALLTCDDAGVIELVGLDAGTYTVTEVEAPSGYAAGDAFTFALTSDLDSDPVGLTASVTGAEASVVSVDVNSGVVAVSMTNEAEGGSSAGSGDEGIDDEDAEEGEDASATSSDADSDSDDSSSSSFLSKTGDKVFAALVALAVLVAAGLLIPPAARRRQRNEGGRG